MKVTYIDHMGTDLSVVNAARVSFGKKSEWVEVQDGKEYSYYLGETKTLSNRDKGLIQFLARGCTTGDWDTLVEKIVEDSTCFMDPDKDVEAWANYERIEEVLRHVKNMPTHWTPFAHTAITLHIKAPIFVARQLGKHQVGMVWNEVSRRYVEDTPELYHPGLNGWRERAENVKQGSSDEMAVIPEGMWHDDMVMDFNNKAIELYLDLIKRYGVCPEQARMVLPQSMMTEWYWTGNLYSFANVYIQRTDPHAQKEVQEVAHQIGEIIEPLFPISWKALTQ